MGTLGEFRHVVFGQLEPIGVPPGHEHEVPVIHNDEACAAVGATNDATTGNATAVASPIRFIS
ncbi:MAG TPA: hypothetical protein PKM58_08120 [Pyrinomonadaceae bacterium]|nr:hypothetical protein [Pyrinomonadaceae bacterium]